MIRFFLLMPHDAEIAAGAPLLAAVSMLFTLMVCRFRWLMPAFRPAAVLLCRLAARSRLICLQPALKTTTNQTFETRSARPSV